MCATHDVSRASFDKISSDLGQKIEAMTSELKNISGTVVSSPGNVPVSSPGSSTGPVLPLFALLGNSKLLPRLDQKDYTKLAHWGPMIYRKLRRKVPKSEDAVEDDFGDLEADSPGPDERREPKKKDPILSRFLEDKDGNPISESDKKAILAMAASFWQYLLDNDRAPKNFRQTNIEIKLQWQILMESNFECLRYCDNHWKVDQLWINYYPSWLKTALRKIKEEKARLQAEQEAADAVIDVDDDNEDEDDEDDDDDVVETSKSRKNKRGPPDSGETNKSKRVRVEEPREPTPPPPAPAKATTKRARVRTLYLSVVCITENL